LMGKASHFATASLHLFMCWYGAADFDKTLLERALLMIACNTSVCHSNHKRQAVFWLLCLLDMLYNNSVSDVGLCGCITNGRLSAIHILAL